MQPGNPFRIYLVAVLAALWIVLALASARGGKWPVAGLCTVMAIANAVMLYRLTRRASK